MDIIVTGSGGQLGTALKKIAAGEKKFKWYFEDRKSLDIADPEAIKRYFSRYRKNQGVLINCAAYTDVEKAEIESEKAFRVNCEGPALLAKAALGKGMRFIHISTDFVFSGDKGSPYTENDRPDPMSVYGRSKYAGELELMKFEKDILIIRTSWLYSATHKTFMRKVFEKLKAGEEARVVSDEKGSPTRSGDLAAAIIKIIDHRNFQDGFSTDLFHFCNFGTVSRYDYARKIAEYSGYEAEIEPILSKDLNMKAKRPADSSMCCEKISSRFGIKIRSWQNALKEETDVLRSE